MYNPFEIIEARTLRVRPGKRGPWIKTHGQRVNLASANSHSNTETGKTYIFNDTGDKVKQLNNYM